MTLAYFIISNWTEVFKISPFSHGKWLHCFVFYAIQGLLVFYHVQFGNLKSVEGQIIKYNFVAVSIAETGS